MLNIITWAFGVIEEITKYFQFSDELIVIRILPEVSMKCELVEGIVEEADWTVSFWVLLVIMRRYADSCNKSKC